MKNTIFTVDRENKKEIVELDQVETQKYVKILFNKTYFTKVNKEKLVNKSLYFKAIRKECYTDIKSEFVEVNFETSRKIFKQVMQYISSGEIYLNKRNLYKVFSLAVYLQMNDLEQLCLDYFTFFHFLRPML